MEYELPALALMGAGICIGWLAASAIYYRRSRLARWDAKNEIERMKVQHADFVDRLHAEIKYLEEGKVMLQQRIRALINDRKPKR